jgi:voltage-gated potassium channel Kch
MKLTKKRKKLITLGIAALSLFIIGTCFYHYYEGMEWIDALYFTTMTLASVGYGDHVPVTPGGKLFTIGFVIIGITTLIAFLDTVTRIRVSEHMEHIIHHIKNPSDIPHEEDKKMK